MSALQADFLYQISKMFLIMAAGWLAVKIKLVPASAGKGISQLAAFIVKPFAIFYAFQVEFSVAQLQGLLLAVGAAVLTHGVFILLARVTGKGLLHMTPEERACVIYTNSGNLLMPLVLAVMGQQWLFYTCAYMAVLQCFVWTHGRSLVCQSHGIQWKKALLNVNILVTLFSLGCFCCRLIVHGILADAVESIADTQGAVNMISLGISFAALKNLNWKKLARVLGVAVQRLVVYPAVILGVFILTGLPHVLPNANQILLITLLAAAAPSAVVLNQIAQVSDRDPGDISLINVVTMLCSIVTLPGTIWVYERLVAPF